MFKAIIKDKYNGFNDIDLQKEFLKELWLNDVPEIPWYFLQKTEPSVWDDDYDNRVQWDCQLIKFDVSFKRDNLYGEDLHKVFDGPVYLRVFIESEIETQDLTKYGIDEKRPVTAKLLIPLLDAKNLTSWISIGDKFVYDGYEYEVLTVKRDTYWINTEIPLELKITASRFRQGDRINDDC